MAGSHCRAGLCGAGDGSRALVSLGRRSTGWASTLCICLLNYCVVVIHLFETVSLCPPGCCFFSLLLYVFGRWGI